MEDEGIRELIDSQFDSFRNGLRSHLAGLEIAKRLCELRKTREENKKLEVSVDQLDKEVRKWINVKNHLLDVNWNGPPMDENNNVPVPKESTTVNFVDDNSTNLILHALASKIGNSSADCDKEEQKTVKPVDQLVRASSVTFKTKKARIKKEVKKEGAKRDTILTRRKRGLKGGSLINPFQYYDCLLCKAGYYKDADLRKHYSLAHKLDFGDAALPSDKLQIACPQVDRQTSTKCNICKSAFSTIQELMIHKSNHHVQTRYRRHICPECQMRFVLANELEDHMMVHSF